MKIAILSDTRLPTRWDYAGHGLGKVALSQADGLRKRGHAVTLYAGPESAWDGPTQLFDDESEYGTADFGEFDAVLDNTHHHELQQTQPDLKILNFSNDREAKPGRCAAFPSEAHKAWHGSTTGRVIHSGISEPAAKPEAPRGYFAYMASMYREKAPVWAANAARLAGVKLVMAGPTPPAYPAMDGVDYIGPVSGDDKWRFLARAEALIFPATTEAGTITPLEAQAVGCPVLVSDWGAAKEMIAPGQTGLIARDTLEMAEAIGKVKTLTRGAACRAWVLEHRGMDRYIDGIEKALQDVIKGEVW